jgi:hypothetical protein
MGCPTAPGKVYEKGMARRILLSFRRRAKLFPFDYVLD